MTPELQAELDRREKQDIRPKGAALIARLFKGLLERGVDTMLETRARELITNDAGDVIGLVAEHDGSSAADRHPQGRRARLRWLRVESRAGPRASRIRGASRSARPTTPATAC